MPAMTGMAQGNPHPIRTSAMPPTGGTCRVGRLSRTTISTARFARGTGLHLPCVKLRGIVMIVYFYDLGGVVIILRLKFCVQLMHEGAT
jgi:hypothetical protein